MWFHCDGLNAIKLMVLTCCLVHVCMRGLRLPLGADRAAVADHLAVCSPNKPQSMLHWPSHTACAPAGELFFIGYQIDAKPPCCHYAGLDAAGGLAFDHKVDLQEGVMMHDMAVTQDYGIIVDTPLVFRPEVRRRRIGGHARLGKTPERGRRPGLGPCRLHACRDRSMVSSGWPPGHLEDVSGASFKVSSHTMYGCIRRQAAWHAPSAWARLPQWAPEGVCACTQVMVTQDRLPLVFDKSRPARFGVLPKRPKSGKEIRWFEAPPGAGALVSCMTWGAVRSHRTWGCGTLVQHTGPIS